MKISIFGLGYVGLANAFCLGQHDEVMGYDINSDRIAQLKQGVLPIVDKEMSQFLSEKRANVEWTTDFEEAVFHGEYLIISTPTDYDEQTNYFDTTSIEQIIEQTLKIKPQARFLIKSTIPIGYVERVKKQFPGISFIVFSPEFLREGRALYDNLYPSRIVIGEKSEEAYAIGELFKRNILKKEVSLLYVGDREAESIKLFANTYLALRIAYFNELDTFAEEHSLNTREIIEGISLDERIGNYYNNPSFGYGGYCLPKDTKQLHQNFKNVPENLIEAIVSSNVTRKQFITTKILEKQPKVVGIYRLSMKTGSDNFRYSSILDVINLLTEQGVEAIIYEPTYTKSTFMGTKIVNDLKTFKNLSDVIVTNRWEQALEDVKEKTYTRDLFFRD